ncbi:hypothetical protein NKI25_32625, partial [Mesorhizobium sp. M0808]|uniref:hypothetical protein n=1 Tax=Mesorhizobium sp. M0808 TaxID=2957002 RepID=UPI003334EDB7
PDPRAHRQWLAKQRYRGAHALELPALNGISYALTKGRHAALKHELEREQARPSLVEIGVRFCRDLRARGKPDHGRPAYKAFRDSLYEND